MISVKLHLHIARVDRRILQSVEYYKKNMILIAFIFCVEILVFSNINIKPCYLFIDLIWFAFRELFGFF
jgi:hypothetical protein